MCKDTSIILRNKAIIIIYIAYNIGLLAIHVHFIVGRVLSTFVVNMLQLINVSVASYKCV